MGIVCKKLVVALAAGLTMTACASKHGEPSPEELVKRQARSVHLYYADCPTNGVDSITATVTVRKSYPGTYFAALVWDTGYCGIQELPSGDHVIIFSVWDPVDPFDFSARPEAVREDLRAKVLYADPLMDVARFGGEGTGARTLAGFGWKLDQGVSFKVESEPDTDIRTKYTCWVRMADGSTGDWCKLATISTICHKAGMRGMVRLYSFVEDFARNYTSAQNARRAEVSDVWVQYDGLWHKVDTAYFSADDTPSKNIDAGKIPETGAFFLATGGDTKNETTPFGGHIE